MKLKLPIKLPSLAFLAPAKKIFTDAGALFGAGWRWYSARPKRERVLIACVAGVLAMLAAEFIFIEPLRRAAGGLEEDIRLHETQALQNMRTMSLKPSVDNVFATLLQQSELQGRDDEEIRSTMLQDIETMARAHNLYLGEVKPQISRDSGAFEEFLVRVQVEGRMEEVMQFFNELFSGRRLYYIETFRASPHPEDLNKVKVNAQVIRAILKS